VQRARWDERRVIPYGSCSAAMSDCEARLAAARGFAERAPAEARELPWLQRRWLLWSEPWLDDLARAEATVSNSRRRAEALAILEQEIAHELSKVRAAVDIELEEGRGRACVVDAVRIRLAP
jgi:hypothetical protein